jgi:CheY-like chemotaxis protein
MNEPQAKLLLVDGEVKNNTLIEAWLAPRGYCVSRATNGLEALDRHLAGSHDAGFGWV